MGNLFKKVACFSDIHFGLHHNSKIHNQDCEDFIKWFCKTAKEKNAETCIFLGDWHHTRNTINVSTLNYTMSSLELLNDTFEKVYFITGNHDLMYREKREVHSIPMGHKYPNIVMIEDPFEQGDVSILPWLVGDEWKDVPKIKAKYLFGHLEIPGFKLNAMVEMPDVGEIKSEHFVNQTYVFSGHFHKRQVNGKINYIGNPFGHNYSDVWDFDRGAMFLEWGGEPEYVNYEDGPRFISTTLKQILENPDYYLKPKTHVKATIDVDITYEEANFLRETFLSSYKVREFKLLQSKYSEHEIESDTETEFETVDEIVISELTNIQSDNFDKNILISIYTNL
ncbi:SbcD-like subunit of palindrome specific endonuclease [Pseudomonas phage Cassandra]|uniref:Calcineurin-like phosphoesterase domain-containing protein n=1 Tax=Pseudomonas phage vB_PaeM_PA5oct TaxID=2163605 RepID=A0A4Y1LUF6_9CAUD|nr:SbcD-like subunit of palindrome specific endonuclease [Pseudomonas phage vB_PaeM_PA5oct]WMI32091.1 hypothetical protein GBBBJNDB_00400 [Pseudomonas phage Callisto]WPK39129.1 SbcD-like subunit of palindrome specific endonuclease [Pseudomonas phage Cassandra]WPK39641.1 SbcD-like subunit of palindrome specific endonuclease [Pseudomonas phage Deifobo]WPK40162.1 SbcD-like subunit of palindrome specific endonuclease [Pseudomonas phage Ettore]WPK40677.1 SbcD-like subunit of palindrome specific end